MTEQRCTYEVSYRRLCGHLPEHPSHVADDEPMRRDAHVWRHDPRKVKIMEQQQPGLVWA